MKENNLVIQNENGKEMYKVLLNIEANDKTYIIYTKNEQNDYGDTIAYAGNYEFVDGKQSIKPVEDEIVLEFLDTILMQIQNKMNRGDSSE